jgi:hypothetical protein
MTDFCGHCLKHMTKRDARNRFCCECPGYLAKDKEIQERFRWIDSECPPVCGLCHKRLENLVCTCKGWIESSLKSDIEYELQVQNGINLGSEKMKESQAILDRLTAGDDRQWARDYVKTQHENTVRRRREAHESRFIQ